MGVLRCRTAPRAILDGGYIVVCGDARLSRDLSAGRGRLAGWRAARNVPADLGRPPRAAADLVDRPSRESPHAPTRLRELSASRGASSAGRLRGVLRLSDGRGRGSRVAVDSPAATVGVTLGTPRGSSHLFSFVSAEATPRRDDTTTVSQMTASRQRRGRSPHVQLAEGLPIMRAMAVGSIPHTSGESLGHALGIGRHPLSQRGDHDRRVRPCRARHGA